MRYDSLSKVLIETGMPIAQFW